MTSVLIKIPVIYIYIYFGLDFVDKHNIMVSPGSDIDIIQLSIDNYVNDLFYMFSCNSLSFNITKIAQSAFLITSCIT